MEPLRGPAPKGTYVCDLLKATNYGLELGRRDLRRGVREWREGVGGGMRGSQIRTNRQTDGQQSRASAPQYRARELECARVHDCAAGSGNFKETQVTPMVGWIGRARGEFDATRAEWCGSKLQTLPNPDCYDAARAKVAPCR